MKQKGTVCSQIRNARASLDNAERSFSSNQAVRGELDLMLAEAELQNLRKRRDGRFSWTRQTLAAGSAFLLLTAAGLGWCWASVHPGSGRAVGKTPSVAADMPSAARQSDSGSAGAKVSMPASAVVNLPAEGGQAVAGKVPASEEKNSSRGKDPTAASAAKPAVPSSIRLSAGQLHQLVRSGKQELSNPR